jgi:TPR repeat protein
MTKPFARCSLPDLALEFFLSAGSALDAAAAQLLPRLADAEATEAALQRHPLVRSASGLVCTGNAESEHAWFSMLADLFSASGAAVSDADIRRVCISVYLVCRQCCGRGRVRVCPFISRVLSHPAAAAAGNELLAQLMAHPVRCLASQINFARWRAMLRCHTPSPAHAPHWHVTGIDILLQQRRDLLCRGAWCSFLVPRLLCFQGECSVRQPLNLAQRIASQRHFFRSKKNEEEGVFEEGRRMYEGQRYSDAAESWGQAALLQHGPSHAHASNMMFEGRPGVAKDVKRAVAFASAGAALGCVHSKGALGRCYIHGLGVAQDVARGLALGRESEAAGSCFGQFVVGKCYYKGWGVAQDYAEAERLFRLAAAQGSAAAEGSLANMFFDGHGVAQDFAECARLTRLAAEQGHPGAQNNLANMYLDGLGVAQDCAEAVRLFRLAVAQGEADSQFTLAWVFEKGEGVARDYAEAVQLYRLAAAQGDAEAQNNLGKMFERGRGVAQDREEATRWYRLAAAQGNVRAQANLNRLGA